MSFYVKKGSPLLLVTRRLESIFKLDSNAREIRTRKLGQVHT